MSILTGFLKYKKYKKTSSNTYKKVSEWTDYSTVETNNGTLDDRLKHQTDSTKYKKGKLLTEEYITYIGTCSSAAASASKSVTVSILGNTSNNYEFELYEGCTIDVTFDNSDTSSGDVTLNVNSTGAKSVMYHGSVVNGDRLFKKDIVYTFRYQKDGGNVGHWYVIGDINGVGTSGITTVAFSGASGSHDGSMGLVPAPERSSDVWFQALAGDGTWKLFPVAHGRFAASSSVDIGYIVNNYMENNTQITFNIVDENSDTLTDFNYTNESNNHIINNDTLRHKCRKLTIHKVTNNNYYWEYSFIKSGTGLMSGSFSLEKRFFIGGYDTSCTPSYYLTEETAIN